MYLIVTIVKIILLNVEVVKMDIRKKTIDVLHVITIIVRHLILLNKQAIVNVKNVNQISENQMLKVYV